MKTKYLFYALGLGALAACSNEEFVDQAISEANLPKVNITIGAEFGKSANTRQSYDDDLTNWNYYWTKNDIIGACKASGTDGTLDAGDKIASNHPFANDLKEGELAKATSFSTVTAVTTGKYVFYTPYKKSMLGNETVNPKLPEIQLQEGTSRKHLMDNNFFITPMLNITNEKGAEFEYGAKIDLPLTFKSIYHTLKMEIGIDSSDPSKITVDKIVVTPVDNSDAAIATKNGEPLDFAKIASGITAGTGEANIVTIGAAAVADKNALATNVKENLDKLMDVNVDILDGTAVAQSYTLKVKDGYTYSVATDKCVATMLIPAGAYNKLKFEVYTSEGIYTEIVALSATPANTVKMQRNAVTALNKSLNIKYNIGDNNVKPIQNFAINSVDDWNYACKFVADHFNQFGDDSKWGTPTFTLNKDIEIDAYPTFGLKLAASASRILTVKAASFNLSKTGIDGTNITIKVAKGSTLTIDKEIANGDTNLKLVNHGTIVNNIVPTATLTTSSLKFVSLINGEDTKNGAVGTIINNGSMTPTALTNNLTSIINNAAGAKIIAGASTITNLGKINLGENSTLDLTGTAALTNTGTVTVAAKAKVTDIKGSATVVGTDGNIIIKDVNNFTLAPATLTDQIVSAEVANSADFMKAVTTTGDFAKITDVTVTAGIKTDAAVDAPNKNVILKNNLTLGAAFTVKAIIADGTSTIAADAAYVVSAALTVNAGKELTVGENITFNAYNAATTVDATILGTLTNNGKMYFAAATVGEAKNPVAKNGVLNVTVPGAIFAAKAATAITNHGTVTQSGTAKIGPSVNNQGVATFNGNADAATVVPAT